MQDIRLRVSIPDQTLEFWEGDTLVKAYPISTSKFGVGTQPGSLCTPPGRLRVARKIGSDLPKGAVLKERQWTGSVWSLEDPYQEEADLILTRILWLEGLDPENTNTLDRYIYIHGTNQEHLIGQPASHGCVRMSNSDIAELFDRVPEGTEVTIATA
ncbi:MAG TPA: L,D-transpeptidase [Verrucomicrobiae bacterium]|nr:L,D-transpeptidase [Verrucomicrobiae bacterium]